MKNVLILFLIILMGVGVATSQEKKGAQLTWDIEKHDYGTVYTDEMPETKLDIKFTNDGTEPLILSNVRACCGTRVHDWPRQPIMPGEEGIIKIEFRLTPTPQRISRTVTVTSNAEPKTTIFRILGELKNR